MSPTHAERTARARAVRRVLLLTLAANLLVVVAKLVAGIAAGALSVVAEAAHSSVDACNNLVALVLSRIAAKAPDEDHPYGHAKFETLGAIVIVGFLSITVYELVTGALHRLVTGTGQPQATSWVVGTMVFSTVVSLIVSRYEHRRGMELRSDILMADAAHTRSDVYASVAVLGGLGLVALGYPRADAIFTLLLAGIIGLAVVRIVRRSVPVLVDERAVDEVRIREIALDVEGVLEVREIRSRGRLGDMFAELTILVPPRLNVEEAHLIADDVERRVAGAFGARSVIAHVEPYGHAHP